MRLCFAIMLCIVDDYAVVNESFVYMLLIMFVFVI